MNRETTSDRFDKPTIVEVWVPGCSPCKAMDPDLQLAATRYKGFVDLVQLNAATDHDEVAAIGVMGTPTIVGYRAGEEVFRYTGRKSAGELDNLFAALKSGHGAPRVGSQDLVIRVGAVVGMAGIGMVTGPTWVLVGTGALAVAFGVVSWLRSSAH